MFYVEVSTRFTRNRLLGYRVQSIHTERQQAMNVYHRLVVPSCHHVRVVQVRDDGRVRHLAHRRGQ